MRSVPISPASAEAGLHRLLRRHVAVGEDRRRAELRRDLRRRARRSCRRSRRRARARAAAAPSPRRAPTHRRSPTPPHPFRSACGGRTVVGPATDGLASCGDGDDDVRRPAGICSTRSATTFGPTEWIEITQERVNTVRRRDRRPPVDPRRRGAGEGRAVRRHDRPRLPHAVALCAPFLVELVHVSNISMGINYGVNKARFLAPVHVGGSHPSAGRARRGDRGRRRGAGRRPDHGRDRGRREARGGGRDGQPLPRLMAHDRAPPALSQPVS